MSTGVALKCSWCDKPATARGNDGTYSCGQGQGDGLEPHNTIRVPYIPMKPTMVFNYEGVACVLSQGTMIFTDKKERQFIEEDLKVFDAKKVKVIVSVEEID